MCQESFVSKICVSKKNKALKYIFYVLEKHEHLCDLRHIGS